MKIVVHEMADRGLDITLETLEEVLQEGATITGTQLGSLLDTGDWAYSFGDVTDRLWDTAKNSALTFGLTSIPSAVHNIDSRMTQLAAQGEARLRSGEMPTSEQLEAMNMSEAEALGMMAVFQMVDADGAEGTQLVASNTDLKPQYLMDELMNSGEKCTIDEVIVVAKTTDDILLWLEQGNQKSGLTHITERHSDDFASQGIEDIPQLLNEVLKTKHINKGHNQKGLYADYVLNGNTYRIAYGTNGYIVSFYPID